MKFPVPQNNREICRELFLRRVKIVEFCPKFEKSRREQGI
jgi:hypothetical protein